MVKYAVIDTRRCRPSKCGVCAAVEVCTHHLLEQEGSNEVPVLWSTRACVGCGRCVKACPLSAISIRHGT